MPTTNKVRVNGHYETTRTPWATDYVWVPGEEEVEERLRIRRGPRGVEPINRGENSCVLQSSFRSCCSAPAR